VFDLIVSVFITARKTAVFLLIGHLGTTEWSTSCAV